VNSISKELAPCVYGFCLDNMVKNGKICFFKVLSRLRKGQNGFEDQKSTNRDGVSRDFQDFPKSITLTEGDLFRFPQKVSVRGFGMVKKTLKTLEN